MRMGHDYNPESSLSLQDMAVDNHANTSMVRIHLVQSNTDHFRHGVDIYLGWIDAALCPVAAILAYSDICPPCAGPFFMFQDGSSSSLSS